MGRSPHDPRPLMSCVVACVVVAALSLGLAGTAEAVDPAAQLELVPPGAAEVVGVDLEGPQRAAAVGLLRGDAVFEQTWGWLQRARLERRATSALLVADGVGQRAIVLTLGELGELERQTLDAMLRAAGLAPQAPRSGAVLWESPEASYAVLVLSPQRFIAGERGVVLQVAEGLGRRGRRPAAPALAALESPERSAAFFVSLSPGAAAPSPVATTGRLLVDGGALIEVRLTCRTEEDARALRGQLRAWMGDAGRALELEALGLEPSALEGALVTQVEERLHVVLTLAPSEVEAALGRLEEK